MPSTSPPATATTGTHTAERHRPMALTLGAGSALMLRMGIGAPRVAQSVPAAIIFGFALIAMAGTAGWRPRSPRAGGVATGVAGAVALIVVPAAIRGVPLAGHMTPLPRAWPVWFVALGLVVAGEEIMLRGALFGAILDEHGTIGATIVTSVLFGLIHVPLYGWVAVPLDIAVGVWLAGLRLLTGGIAAPLTAHLLADLAPWWLP